MSEEFTIDALRERTASLRSELFGTYDWPLTDKPGWAAPSESSDMDILMGRWVQWRASSYKVEKPEAEEE